MFIWDDKLSPAIRPMAAVPSNV